MKIKKTLAGLMIFGLAFIITSLVMSDTGYEGAIRKEIGRYLETSSTAISTSAATAFISVSVKRPDGFCKNYSSYVVFIGSNTSNLVDIGMPLGASDYFDLGGSFTDAIYATAEAGAGANTADMRCFYGLVR